MKRRAVTSMVVGAGVVVAVGIVAACGASGGADTGGGGDDAGAGGGGDAGGRGDSGGADSGGADAGGGDARGADSDGDAPTCGAGLVDCAGACIDPTTSAAHCGATGACGAEGGSAGVACPGTETCTAGRCVPTCAAPQTLCLPDGGEATCANLTADPNNCGACGTVCPGAPTPGTSVLCTAGHCVAPTCSDALKNQDETDVDCGGTHCPKCASGKTCGVPADCASGVCLAGQCAVAGSCREILTADATAASGVYHLGDASGFDAYCDMAGDGGGWTLLLKANGSLATFVYGAAAWTDASVLNESSTDMSFTEAKFRGFSTMPVGEVRVGLAVLPSGAPSFLHVTLATPAASLMALFSGGTTTTSAGKAAWLALVPGSKLEANCNLEGFNVQGNAAGGASAVQERIGILANNEGDCSSPDSRLGIGGHGLYTPSGPANVNQSVGNVGNVNGAGTVENYEIDAFGFVMIR